MKRSIVILCMLIGICQWARATVADSIAVSVYKSTFIYFDAPVVQTDLGMDASYDVAFEKNYVKITALQQSASYQTNLTVVTTAGIYGFLVNYADHPKKLYYFPEDYSVLRRFDGKAKEKPALQPVKVPDNYNAGSTDVSKTTLQDYCKELLEDKMNYPITGYSKAQMSFYMDKIYVKDNLFFLKFNLKNDSNIDFDLDFVKFHIRNRKKMKRSSKQEIYLEPVYAYNEIKTIESNSSGYMVYVIDKFTIMNDKQFFVEFEEDNGERNVAFQVLNKDIINAEEL